MREGCPNCATYEARARAAEQELVVLRKKLRARNGGRPAGAPQDEKTSLVDAACMLHGFTRQELAEKLEVDPARLSPSGKFAAEDQERLMGELRKLATVPTGTPLEKVLRGRKGRRGR